MLLVDNEANNSDAVCSWWWCYPRVTANEECAGLSVIVTVALLSSYCDASFCVTLHAYTAVKLCDYVTAFLNYYILHIISAAGFIDQVS